MRLLSTGCLGLGLAALVAATGCSSEGRYVWRPEENANARVSGAPAALYEVPPQAPHGEVRVATLGMTMLQPLGDDGKGLRALHVRMVASNNDDSGPWEVDTREQIGFLEPYGQSKPAFASSSFGKPPLVSVPPTVSATIDLYYPMPASMQDAPQVPHFEVLWRVRTPEGPVAERTTFERIHIEPPPPRSDYAWGWGFGWSPWYDPLWPDAAFLDAPILSPVYYRGAPPRPPPPPPPARR